MIRHECLGLAASRAEDFEESDAQATAAWRALRNVVERKVMFQIGEEYGRQHKDVKLAYEEISKYITLCPKDIEHINCGWWTAYYEMYT